MLLKKNSHTQSGLYDRLPSMTLSNISSVADPEERVLGFFGVSGVAEIRYFVREVEGLSKYDVRFCWPAPERPRCSHEPYARGFGNAGLAATASYRSSLS